MTNSQRYLMLSNEVDAHGKNSGYTHLADYIPHSKLLKAPRLNPSGLSQRLILKFLTRFTGALWCRFGSFKVERQAIKEMNAGFKGLVHILWGDQDWGFLDYFTPKAGVPLCASFHCCPDTLPEVLRYPSRLRKLSAVILMSEVQRPFFLNHGVFPERIHIMHHGIDCDFFKPLPSHASEPFTILFVGNYRRNFTRLIEVCQRLAAYPDIKIKVVAPSYHRDKFANMPNVLFCSGLNDEELREVYQSASCLLMTVDAATANNAILEAMACGLPIVSEDVGGISEYTGRDAAILCPAGSVDDLMSELLKLRAHPIHAAKLGFAGRSRALELNWSTAGQNMVRLYEKVLAYRDGASSQ